MKAFYDKRKYDLLDIAFLIFVVWSAGGATSYQGYLYSPNSITTIPIVLVCMYMLHRKKCTYFNPLLLKIVFLLLVWGAVGTYCMGYNCHYFYLIYNIFLAYTLLKVFGVDVFRYYEKIVTGLSLIALVAFFAVVAIPSLGGLLKAVSIENSGSLWESNVLLFGIQYIDPSAAVIFPRRNLGFAWEPGRFAVLIVMAMFINLVTHGYKLKGNSNFWILFVTLITTQSTTGYACGAFVFLLYFYNSKYKPLVIPASVVVLLVFTSLSFMNEKIAETWNWQENQAADFASQMDYYSREDIAFVPQRFEGMFYDILNFIHSPLWGYGIDWRNSYVNTVMFPGGRIYASDGAVQIFASCGLLVALGLYYLLYKTSVTVSSVFSSKGKWAYFILFTLVNFSYNFWAITIFTTFLFYPIFTNEKIQAKCHNRGL